MPGLRYVPILPSSALYGLHTSSSSSKEANGTRPAGLSSNVAAIVNAKAGKIEVKIADAQSCLRCLEHAHRNTMAQSCFRREPRINSIRKVRKQSRIFPTHGQTDKQTKEVVHGSYFGIDKFRGSRDAPSRAGTAPRGGNIFESRILWGTVKSCNSQASSVII